MCRRYSFSRVPAFKKNGIGFPSVARFEVYYTFFIPQGLQGILDYIDKNLPQVGKVPSTGGSASS